MNSLYGATANQYFAYYILEMAEAITLSGQLSLKTAAKWVNEWLNKALRTKDFDYVVYCVDGDTSISLASGDEKISDLFARMNKSEIDGVKNVADEALFAKSFNITTREIELKRVTAVIKRRAMKKMYRVWQDDERYVDVSSDHRFIVNRGGFIVEVTAEHLLESDIFINT